MDKFDNSFNKETKPIFHLRLFFCFLSTIFSFHPSIHFCYFNFSKNFLYSLIGFFKIPLTAHFLLDLPTSRIYVSISPRCFFISRYPSFLLYFSVSPRSSCISRSPLVPPVFISLSPFSLSLFLCLPSLFLYFSVSPHSFFISLSPLALSLIPDLPSLLLYFPIFSLSLLFFSISTLFFISPFPMLFLSFFLSFLTLYSVYSSNASGNHNGISTYSVVRSSCITNTSCAQKWCRFPIATNHFLNLLVSSFIIQQHTLLLLLSWCQFFLLLSGLLYNILHSIFYVLYPPSTET